MFMILMWRPFVAVVVSVWACVDTSLALPSHCVVCLFVYFVPRAPCTRAMYMLFRRILHTPSQSGGTSLSIETPCCMHATGIKRCLSSGLTAGKGTVGPYPCTGEKIEASTAGQGWGKKKGPAFTPSRVTTAECGCTDYLHSVKSKKCSRSRKTQRTKCLFTSARVNVTTTHAQVPHQHMHKRANGMCRTATAK